SLNPDKLLVSSATDTPGQSAVTLTDSAQFYVQGLAAEGSAEVRLHAAGYDDAVVTVDFLPVVLAPDSSELRFAPPGNTSSLGLRLGLVEFGRINTSWNGSVRPGVTVPVTVRSVDSSIVQLSGSQAFVFQGGGPSACYFPIAFLRPGDTQILIETSSGIPLSPDRVTVHVENWRLSAYLSNTTVGRSLMIQLQAGSSRRDPVSATLSSSSGTLLFSTERLTAGKTSLALDLDASGSKTIFLEGAGPAGSSEISVSATTDFDTATTRLQIVDPVVRIGGVNNSGLTIPLSAGSASVPVTLGLDTPFGSGEQPLGASQSTIVVKVQSSNPAVVRPAVDSLDFRPGESSRSLSLQLAGKGTALITVQAPAGFNLPAGTRDYLVTVQ
ncbi:MAG TPA: hypothetical protein VIX89_16040, partial [Bryobacteraceae bacterium]